MWTSVVKKLICPSSCPISAHLAASQWAWHCVQTPRELWESYVRPSPCHLTLLLLPYSPCSLCSPCSPLLSLHRSASGQRGAHIFLLVDWKFPSPQPARPMAANSGPGGTCDCGQHSLPYEPFAPPLHAASSFTRSRDVAEGFGRLIDRLIVWRLCAGIIVSSLIPQYPPHPQ